MRRPRTIRQLCAFIEGNEAVIFHPQDRGGAYTFVRETLVRFGYVTLGKRDKGAYLTNLVDEVTQFEFVGAVVGISERFLVPLLEGLLLSFPFPIPGFLADNGSEYINHQVAALLEKLRVGRFTKSRSRHSNDNAPDAR